MAVKIDSIEECLEAINRSVKLAAERGKDRIMCCVWHMNDDMTVTMLRHSYDFPIPAIRDADKVFQDDMRKEILKPAQDLPEADVCDILKDIRDA